MSDIASLGLRLDANGFISDVQRAMGALDGLGERGGRTHQKLERFTTATAYGLSNLAAGGQVSLGRLATSMENLAFAFGPVAGGIGLGLGVIVHLFEQLEDKSEKAAKAVERNFGRMSRAGIESQVAAARRQSQSTAEDIASYMPQRTGYVVYDAMMENIPGGYLPSEKRDELERYINKTHEAERALKDFDRDASAGFERRIRLAEQEAAAAGLTGVELDKRRIEDAAANALLEARKTLSGDLLVKAESAIEQEKRLRTAAVETNAAMEKRRKIAEDWYQIHRQQDAETDRIFAANLARTPDSIGEAINHLVEAAARQMEVAQERARQQQLDAAGGFGRDIQATAKRDADEFGRVIGDWIDKMREATAVTDRMLDAEKRKEAVVLGGFVGFAGGLLSRSGGVPGAIGSAIQGGIAGAGGGPVGIAAGAFYGLTSALMGSGDEAARVAEQLRSMKFSFESFVDAVDFELGTLDAGEKAARDTARQFAQERGTLLGAGPMSADEAERYVEELRRHGAYITPELQRQLDELNRREQELVNKRREEADAIDRINNALRNAPSGFFLERYIGAVVNPSRTIEPVAGGFNPVSVRSTDPIGSGGLPQLQPIAGGFNPIPSQNPNGGGVTVVVYPGGIIVEGTDPDTAFRHFMEGLRRHATRTVGTFGKLSDALNVA